MDEKKDICWVCGKYDVLKQANSDLTEIFYECPICGRYQLSMENDIYKQINKDQLAAYLYYNAFKNKKGSIIERRYHTTKPKEQCDKYVEEYENGNHIIGRPVYMDEHIVGNWYPERFSDRIDMVLLKLFSLSDYMGADIKLDIQSLFSCTFVKRYDREQMREERELINQALYMMKYLQKVEFIEGDVGTHGGMNAKDAYFGPIKLAPKGYERIDELQKKGITGNNVLVAMKFGDETRKLREGIRQGITDAGYHAVFIDEVEHNELITPELMSHIRNSRFVVVDLTHNNCGAYFEEGYAIGLGKTVIQMCKSGTQMHFDIAQKNTIIWENESDIPLRLCNRIKATID